MIERRGRQGHSRTASPDSPHPKARTRADVPESAPGLIVGADLVCRGDLNRFGANMYGLLDLDGCERGPRDPTVT